MWTAVVYLLACLAVTIGVTAQDNASRDDAAGTAAQDKSPSRHAQYRVMDVGTFGGPTSGYTFGSVIINDHGAVVGVADTAIFDANCGCFVSVA
jgi:hypothetical protein